MITARNVLLSVALSATLSTSAFAARSDIAQEPHRVVHKHHLAHYVKPNTASDADRDAGMYVVKPRSEPEYFGHQCHGKGSQHDPEQAHAPPKDRRLVLMGQANTRCLRWSSRS